MESYGKGNRHDLMQTANTMTESCTWKLIPFWHAWAC